MTRRLRLRFLAAGHDPRRVFVTMILVSSRLASVARRRRLSSRENDAYRREQALPSIELMALGEQ